MSSLTTDGTGSLNLPLTLDGLNSLDNTISESALLVDGSNTMHASLNLGSNRLINVASGIAGSDGVNVSQVSASLAGYLPLTGTTSSLNMNNNKISGLSNGVLSTDAATVGQISTATAAYLPLSGGTLSGGLSMGNNSITNLASAVNDSDAATWLNVKARAALYLPASGGTISGGLAVHGIINATGTISNFQALSATSAILTGPINMNTSKITNLGNGSAATDAATLQNVINIINSSGFLPSSGGTMTGDLNLGGHWVKGSNTGTPPTPDTLISLAYSQSEINAALVNYLQRSGGAMTGAIAMGANKVTGLANGTVSSDAAAFGQIASATANYLPLAGGLMSGILDMGWNKIQNVFPGGSGLDAPNINQMNTAITTAVGSYLPLSGGTLTGNLQAPSNNIQSLSLSTGTFTAISSQSNTATIGSIAMSTTMSTGKITGLQPGTVSNDAVNYAQLQAPPPRTAWNSGEVVNTVRCYQSPGLPAYYPNTLLNTYFASGMVGSQTNAASLIHTFTYTPLQASNYIITVTYDMPFVIGGTGGDAWFVTLFGGAVGSGIRLASKTFTVVASNANRSQPLMPITGIYIADSSVSPPLKFGVYLDTSGSNDAVTMGSDQGFIWFTMQLTETRA